MNLQFRIEGLDRQTMDNISNQFKQLGMEISSSYLRNGRPVEKWNEDVNGLTLKLNNKQILRLHKTSGLLVMKHIPEEYQADLIEFFKQSSLVEEPNYGLGIGLTTIFAFLAFLVLAVKAQDQDSSVIVTVLSTSLILITLGIIMLAVTSPKNIKKDPMFIISGVVYFIGAIGFVPSSMLTLPLTKALIQKRYYRFLSK